MKTVSEKSVEYTIKIVMRSVIKLVHKCIYSDVSTSYIQIKKGFSYSILKPQEAILNNNFTMVRRVLLPFKVNIL